MNLIKNLKIRHKLYLISIISILSILLVGYIANYCVQTSNVVAIILKGHRIHNVNFHASARDFYKYLATKDTNDLLSSRSKMAYSEELALTFSSISTTPYQMSSGEFTKSIYNSFHEAIGDDYTLAELTANRVKFLLWFKNQELLDAANVARKVYEAQVLVRKTTQNILVNPSIENINKLSEDIQVVTGYEKKFADSINAINVHVVSLLNLIIILIVIVLGTATLLFSLLISSYISKPVRSIIRSFEELAKGDLNSHIEINSKDEIGRLGLAINNTLEVLRNITHHARQIATGNYDKLVTPLSDKDELSHALNEMTISLKTSTVAIQRETWQKNGIAGLNDLLRGDKALNQITDETLSYFVGYLDAKMGIIYLADDQQILHLTSSYAYIDRTGNFSEIKPGEGLIGQALVEQKTIEFSGIRENAPIFNSGLYAEIPNHLLVSPLIFDKEVAGVLVLASMDKFSPEEKEFVEKATAILSAAIFSAISRTRIQKLLIQTQHQAEKLQVQQEELRQNNEELEAQTQALKASEEVLQTQQEELRVTNEELEEKSKSLEKERDIVMRKNEELELMQEEVTRKANDLEIASKYKSEFLANMSHELRTPLNSILVLSQLLVENKAKTLSEKQIEFARTINSSGSDLLALINDILDLSKVESGKVDLVIEKVSISETFNMLSSIFMPLANEKSIGLEFFIDEKTPESIHSDTKRLNQILKNLLSNAIKFTDQGKVTCRFGHIPPNVEIKRKDLQNKKLFCFTIDDTGIGIATDKQQLIFEAFQQVDGTTSRKYGGTGLGLTISRSFAEIIGGEILLLSEPGKGSKFMLIINESLDTANAYPLADSSVVMENKVSPKETNKAKPKTEDTAFVNNGTVLIKKDGKNTLLIIEDDSRFSSILESLATEKGFQCILAQDGETGLRYADYYKPDAIILDVGLPGIDGYEVMRRLKDNPYTGKIPVHFITANDNELDALNLGAVGFLTKPVSVEKISQSFKRIEDIISRKVKRLLIVEDDPAMSHSIKELTTADGVNIIEVADGSEAYEYLLGEIVDCIILDLGLKKMSGFELLEKIRTNENLRQIPVIIYTGKDLSREEEEKLKRYADSIIIKGVKSPDRLVAETTLFLHQLAHKSDAQYWQQMQGDIHDKDTVLKGKKILIVDDDMRNVFALSSVLEEKGLIVMAGRNGVDGLDKLRNNNDISLVLMDIMMPEMDGYEAMRQIRANSNLKHIPVIALTAKAMKDDREKCIAAGANDYLVKPVDTAKLISLLRVWLYK